MKALFLLFFLFIAPQAIAGKEYSIEIKVIDGATNEIISGCPISVTTKKKEVLELTATEEGWLLENIGTKKLFIDVEDHKDKFIERTVQFFNKKRIDTVFIVYLYPNEAYEKRIIKEEDSLYGSFDNLETPVSSETDDFIDIPAEFLGGSAKLQEFIVSEVRYPQECIDLDAQGKVYLKFIVEPDGRITHVTLERGTGNLIDNEAVRAIRAMPNWKPAVNVSGEKIRSIVRLPIVFFLT